jgi:uncharacterized OB-fold protein
MATETNADVAEYTKPLPPITKLNAPFWEGTKAGELRLQTCNECGKQWYPSSTHCPNCLSRDWAWKAVSGRGKVWSWVVFHQRYFKAFENDLPYNVSFIELEEGVMMMATVRGIEDSEMHCDLPVTVQFEEATDQQSVPYFVRA